MAVILTGDMLEQAGAEFLSATPRMVVSAFPAPTGPSVCVLLCPVLFCLTEKYIYQDRSACLCVGELSALLWVIEGCTGTVHERLMKEMLFRSAPEGSVSRRIPRWDSGPLKSRQVGLPCYTIQMC